MDTELLKLLAQLGPSTAFAVMWWMERKEKLQANGDAKHMTEIAERSVRVSEKLVDVIQDNTEALTALKAEIGQHVS